MYKKLCALMLVLTSSICLAGWSRPPFTDETFQNLLSVSESFQTAGVIYTWSPRMNLSLVGVADLVSICKDLNLDLIILLDPNISDEEATHANHYFDERFIPSYRLQSEAIKDLGVLIHYPSLVLYKNGHVIGTFRPGYDEPDRIRNYLLRRLQ